MSQRLRELAILLTRATCNPLPANADLSGRARNAKQSLHCEVAPGLKGKRPHLQSDKMRGRPTISPAIRLIGGRKNGSRGLTQCLSY